jgi:hypothetical protein
VYAPSASGSREQPKSALRAGGLVLAALAVCSMKGAGAQENPGHFDVRLAEAQRHSDVYYLDARIDFDLSSDAREALRSGLAIVIRIEVEIIHPRRFWFDSEQSLTQRYQLEFHALTERYLVSNLNTGDEETFQSLESALHFIGNVDDLPLIDATLLEPHRRYDVRVRAVLDTDQLPGPLRLLAFWRRDWSIASDWYRWRLQDD